MKNIQDTFLKSYTTLAAWLMAYYLDDKPKLDAIGEGVKEEIEQLSDCTPGEVFEIILSVGRNALIGLDPEESPEETYGLTYEETIKRKRHINNLPPSEIRAIKSSVYSIRAFIETQA